MRKMADTSVSNKDIINLLKTARGQIDGIIKMVEDEKYCIDVSKQILAVQGLIKKSNLKVLDRHMRSCVKNAFENNEGDEKIEEIIMILDKYYK